jgi:UDP:flavonoid glycosyltransferase YjiC (YdhE family)
MPLNFLFTSWGKSGNLNPFLTAARRLRQRGHRVRILGEPDHHQETAKAGVRYALLAAAAADVSAGPRR